MKHLVDWEVYFSECVYYIVQFAKCFLKFFTMLHVKHWLSPRVTWDTNMSHIWTPNFWNYPHVHRLICLWWDTSVSYIMRLLKYEPGGANMFYFIFVKLGHRAFILIEMFILQCFFTKLYYWSLHNMFLKTYYF